MPVHKTVIEWHSIWLSEIQFELEKAQLKPKKVNLKTFLLFGPNTILLEFFDNNFKPFVQPQFVFFRKSQFLRWYFWPTYFFMFPSNCLYSYNSTFWAIAKMTCRKEKKRRYQKKQTSEQKNKSPEMRILKDNLWYKPEEHEETLGWLSNAIPQQLSTEKGYKQVKKLISSTFKTEYISKADALHTKPLDINYSKSIISWLVSSRKKI